MPARKKRSAQPPVLPFFCVSRLLVALRTHAVARAFVKGEECSSPHARVAQEGESEGRERAEAKWTRTHECVAALTATRGG